MKSAWGDIFGVREFPKATGPKILVGYTCFPVDGDQIAIGRLLKSDFGFSSIFESGGLTREQFAPFPPLLSFRAIIVIEKRQEGMDLDLNTRLHMRMIVLFLYYDHCRGTGDFAIDLDGEFAVFLAKTAAWKG